MSVIHLVQRDFNVFGKKFNSCPPKCDGYRKGLAYVRISNSGGVETLNLIVLKLYIF